jgi:hypothetical protein
LAVETPDEAAVPGLSLELLQPVRAMVPVTNPAMAAETINVLAVRDIYFLGYLFQLIRSCFQHGQRPCERRLVGDQSGTLQPFSFHFGVQPLFDPFPGFGREAWCWRRLVIVGMFVGRRTQKLDLPAITAAPTAEKEVAAQTEPFQQRQLAVERG